jgi:hypothetical protein
MKFINQKFKNMKKENTIFGSLFGGKTNEPYGQEKPTPVALTAYSQPHVLQQKMQEEKLTHGATVTANLSPVRLEMDHGHMIMYFCPMRAIEVLETLNEGDGGRIPDEVKVEGLSVPANYRPGFYNLKNVTLTSNGTMQVKATSGTTWERAKF